MILSIDASDLKTIKLDLILGEKIFTHTFDANYDLSERLTGEIEKFLSKQKIKLGSIKKIAVSAGPGHFSRIRTVVATANALAFGLNIKVVPIQSLKEKGKNMILPIYDKAPNITLKKALT